MEIDYCNAVSQQCHRSLRVSRSFYLLHLCSIEQRAKLATVPSPACGASSAPTMFIWVDLGAAGCGLWHGPDQCDRSG